MSTVVTLDVLEQMTGSTEVANLTSVHDALKQVGADTHLNLPTNLAAFLGQVGHESGGFHYVREIWGNPPTKYQAAYEGSAGLGNTQPGDGYRFRGGGLIQLTGRRNYRRFTTWVRQRIADAPDFEQTPDLIEQAPWSALSAIFFWSTNYCGSFADTGNYVGLTHKINGGMLGFSRRLELTARAGLVLLGYAPDAVKKFQGDADLAVDGIAGQNTCNAIYLKLRDLPPVEFEPQKSFWGL